MKYIIVDADTNSILKTKKIITKAIFKYNFTYEIKTYTHFTKELDEEIQDKSEVKTYILDIDLKSDVNGLQIAKSIRKKDIDSYIIFLTSHVAMFELIHRNLYNVFDFIEKFNDVETKLSRDIEAIAKYKLDNKVFRYISRNSEVKVLLKSINYIYRDTVDRHIIIVTDKKEFSLSSSLKSALEQLDNRFIQVHRSCIVNKDNASFIDWSKGYFILNNGEKIERVSKNYKPKKVKN